jgi:hypothetical protein
VKATAIDTKDCHSLIIATQRGVPLDMSRIYSKGPHPDPSDRLIASEVFLRQEPADEEDDEEDESNGKKDDDEDDDEGYSE